MTVAKRNALFHVGYIRGFFPQPKTGGNDGFKSIQLAIGHLSEGHFHVQADPRPCRLLVKVSHFPPSDQIAFPSSRPTFSDLQNMAMDCFNEVNSSVSLIILIAVVIYIRAVHDTLW